MKIRIGTAATCLALVLGLAPIASADRLAQDGTAELSNEMITLEADTTLTRTADQTLVTPAAADAPVPAEEQAQDQVAEQAAGALQAEVLEAACELTEDGDCVVKIKIRLAGKCRNIRVEVEIEQGDGQAPGGAAPGGAAPGGAAPGGAAPGGAAPGGAAPGAVAAKARIKLWIYRNVDTGTIILSTRDAGARTGPWKKIGTMETDKEGVKRLQEAGYTVGDLY